MSIFGFNFGQNADVDIVLDGGQDRRMADFKDENGRKHSMPLFYDGQSVTGKVNVTLHRRTNKIEHNGIKIELIGQIEMHYDRSSQHQQFLSLCRPLAPSGELCQSCSFDFDFVDVEKPYECYAGGNVRLRYFLRVTLTRRLSDMTKELDFLVHTFSSFPNNTLPIKMEVGIDECLHIEFQYNKSRYHLKDVIVGKIYFLLVRIKIKYMEVAILKRESCGTETNVYHENETIAKYEIMDGAPVKGESIPIRVFLAGYDLTPSMREVNKRFSVKYFINLVLVDEEERRYFKQQEIVLWRKLEDGDRSGLGHNGCGGMQHFSPPVGGPPIPDSMMRHTSPTGSHNSTAHEAGGRFEATASSAVENGATRSVNDPSSSSSIKPHKPPPESFSKEEDEEEGEDVSINNGFVQVSANSDNTYGDTYDTVTVPNPNKTNDFMKDETIEVNGDEENSGSTPADEFTNGSVDESEAVIKTSTETLIAAEKVLSEEFEKKVDLTNTNGNNDEPPSEQSLVE